VFREEWKGSLALEAWVSTAPAFDLERASVEGHHYLRESQYRSLLTGEHSHPSFVARAMVWHHGVSIGQTGCLDMSGGYGCLGQCTAQPVSRHFVRIQRVGSVDSSSEELAVSETRDNWQMVWEVRVCAE
jgi:hypothetical protein